MQRYNINLGMTIFEISTEVLILSHLFLYITKLSPISH